MRNTESDEWVGQSEIFVLIILLVIGVVAGIGYLFVKFGDVKPISIVVVGFIALVITIVVEVWLNVSASVFNRTRRI